MSDPKHLLSVPHRQQLSDGDCLAACASMVLAYWQRDIDYSALLQLLNIKAHGARANNILRLAHASQLRVQVAYSATDLTGLMDLVLAGQPVIAFLRTGQLPYWTYSTDHAVVVSGFDTNLLYLNDPDRLASESPIGVSKGDFELAWLERDYFYALITLEK